MSTFKNITIAGAGTTGSIGILIVGALLEAKFDVTILTRTGSTTVFTPEAKVLQVDYANHESLTQALSGQDVLICTFGYTAMKIQEPLIDAAVAAGVKRILPSEFGADPEGPARKLPVFGHKVEVEAYLREKIQGTSTTYTLVANNEFLDWDIDHKFNIDLSAKKMEIFDGGDIAYTTTPMTFVAKGVVAVLQHPEETANRTIKLHGYGTTQNKLLTLFQRIAGEDGWTIAHSSSTEREQQGYAALQQDPSNMYAWAVPLIEVSCFAERFKVDWSNSNDNALLGLKEMSEEEIVDLVKSRL